MPGVGASGPQNGRIRGLWLENGRIQSLWASRQEKDDLVGLKMEDVEACGHHDD